MSRILVLLMVGSLLPLGLAAQNLLDYDWQEKPGLHQLSAAELEEPAYLLFHRQSYEYQHLEFPGVLRQITLTHQIKRLNTDKAIEQHNRIYIPLHGVLKIHKLKARSISPSGVVTEVDQNNIKEIKDNRSGGAYRIIALEGVEKGSEIEYFFVEERVPSLFGRAFMQSSIPCRKALFTLESPDYLQFETKSYNDFPDVYEEREGASNMLVAEVEDIPALMEEEFSNYHANRQRIEYRLYKNYRYSTEQLLTWQYAATTLNQQLYHTSVRDDASINKIFKNLNIDAGMTVAAKIRVIENYIKTNFIIHRDKKAGDIQALIKNGYGSHYAIVKLYAGLFVHARIPHEIGLTSQRNHVYFDAAFASWQFLEAFLFYFPALDKYLAPEDFDYRFPMIPFEYTHNKGMFWVPALELKNPIPLMAIKDIAAPPMDTNVKKFELSVKIPAELNKVYLQVKQTYAGYPAMSIQPPYVKMAGEQRDKMIEATLRQTYADASIEHYTVSGGEPNLNMLEQPFSIDAQLSSSILIEKAGNSKILFKIGQLLGPKAELYQPTPRTLPVESDYKHRNSYKISIQLPEGYSVINLTDINKERVFQQKGKSEPHSLFSARWEQQGNELTILVEEQFREISCNLEEYESFRSVINTAADFNKLTLVLEKAAGM